ncbi:MAG: 30S ribosomal protein S1 [Deltaproteobacteria bacterium]|nr:30S ribosomal protein S1 [Deltaproteobacteria bacterium]
MNEERTMPMDDDSNQDFAQMLESYGQPLDTNLQVGDKLSATVISVGGKSLFLDTGTAKDGVADREEFLDKEGQLTVREGDRIDLYVVEIKPDAVVLSKAVSGVGGLHMLREAFESALPVEGHVTGTCKGGFNVMVLKRRAFCPVSQIDSRYVENPDDYVGRTLPFRIIKFEEKGRNLVLSRRVIIEEDQRQTVETFLADHGEGDAVIGVVTRAMPYGVFVELAPGLEGMVHVSELGWSRVEDPSQAVSIGQDLEVTILSVGRDQKTGQPRISLSAKQAQPDPWETVSEQIEIGQKMTGTVVRAMNFGVFVELLPGIEGLVHISEMSYLKRVTDPSREVRIGERVSVLIKGIDLETRRISLSMKDAEGDPWLDVEERFQVGQTLTGTVEKQEKFGIFINLEPGVTGLLPGSRIGRASNAKELEALSPGDSVAVQIAEINVPGRKISLTPAGQDQPEDKSWQQFAKKSPKQEIGLLGHKLKQAMAGKKTT